MNSRDRKRVEQVQATNTTTNNAAEETYKTSKKATDSANQFLEFVDNLAEEVSEGLADIAQEMIIDKTLEKISGNFRPGANRRANSVINSFRLQIKQSQTRLALAAREDEEEETNLFFLPSSSTSSTENNNKSEN